MKNSTLIRRWFRTVQNQNDGVGDFVNGFKIKSIRKVVNQVILGFYFKSTMKMFYGLFHKFIT